MTERELERREREAAPGMGTPEGRRSHYLLLNPEPTLESLRAELASCVGRVVTVPNAWWLNLVTPESEERRFLSAAGHLPRREVARALSELEPEGWSVLDLVEARAVVHHGDRSTTIVTGLHVTLQRTATT
jgi:hypothetical protein